MKDFVSILVGFLLGVLVFTAFVASSEFREFYLGRMCHSGITKACELNLEYRLGEGD